MRPLLAALLIFACGPPGPKPAPAARPDSARETARLTISGHELDVEVVRTPADRIRGLMFRTELAPDSGMLFVFDSPAVRGFWMKNTLIPLSIAYFDTAGIIADLLHMAPLDTTTSYPSSRPVRYALETNQGWFQTHGIRPGDTVLGIPSAPDR